MPLLTELLPAYHGALSLSGDAHNVLVNCITSDSRQVTGGCIFVAINGTHTDGMNYAMDAIRKGAVAIVTDAKEIMPMPKSVIVVQVDNARLALACFAGALYEPQPEHIVAITGTDGKTSTADFFRQLWQMSSCKAASIGTLGIMGTTAGNLQIHNTTPDSSSLHQALHAMKQEHCDYVAIEASSHGLDQYRLDGVKLQAAAFTNLTRDHLDYHGTLETYFQAKTRLFRDLLPKGGIAVLNADDVKFRRLKEICIERGIRIISYGKKGEHLTIRKVTPTLNGMAVQLNCMGESAHFMLHMVGEFQIMNALAALGLYVSCGGNVQEALKHLPHLHNVPGRLECVATHPSGATIFVDYAHTPAALANVLRTLRQHVKNKLTVVFGCGGDRDRGKRLEMGKVAAEFADNIIITDDNPRSEDPAAIRATVQMGAPHAHNIGDRAEAIARAIMDLRKGDILVIAGKGHEKTQIIGNKTIAFDDADIARYAVECCEKKIG